MGYDRPGQPTKYRPEYCEMLIEHMAKGHSYESFSASVRRIYPNDKERHFSRETVYNWEKDNEEFLYAKKCAFDTRLYELEDIELKIAKGLHNGNITATIHILKNAEPELYGDKQTIDVKGDGANVMAAFSAETLNAMYKDAKAKQAKE